MNSSLTLSYANQLSPCGFQPRSNLWNVLGGVQRKKTTCTLLWVKSYLYTVITLWKVAKLKVFETFASFFSLFLVSFLISIRLSYACGSKEQRGLAFGVLRLRQHSTSRTWFAGVIKGSNQKNTVDKSHDCAINLLQTNQQNKRRKKLEALKTWPLMTRMFVCVGVSLDLEEAQTKKSHKWSPREVAFSHLKHRLQTLFNKH